MKTEIKKKEQTMMCAEELKINNVRNKKLNSQTISKTISKTSGITLIALVVTIVVLLILAGITISLVFSDTGIIAKAREAAEKTEQATINEQAQMNKLPGQIENMLNETGGNTPLEPEMPESWDGNKVNAVESADKVVVPVPKGYTASSVATENKVSEGFVIYENTNGEDKKEEVNDSNKDTARTTRNQFVWVPVANPNEMYGTDKDGKKWGKLYDFSKSGITPINWTEQDGVISITETSSDGSSREPDVVTGKGTEYDAVNSNLQQAGLDSSANSNTFKIQLETEFNNMIASVEKYGGFYIGRYETGNLSQAKVSVVKNNTDIGNQTWYTMYKKAKEIAVNGNVTSSMIWGSQWDATMRWMYNSGSEEKKNYTYDSTGKGYYDRSSSPIATGSIDAYEVNNIYDMAGNVYEKTIEADDTDDRALRGGSYNFDGYTDGYYTPASSRNVSYPTSSANPGPSFDSNEGFRVALYM